MKKRKANLLAEAVVSCSVVFISIAAVTSVLYTAAAVLEGAKDRLVLEKAREMVLAELSAGCEAGGISISGSGCAVEDVSVLDGVVTLAVCRDGFKDRQISYVLWPSAK
jgi:ABC-type glucose/galactose transport system permease subunit